MVPEERETGTLPEYHENGADLTLIRWMMSKTPAERLEILQSFVNAGLSARERQDRLHQQSSRQE